VICPENADLPGHVVTIDPEPQGFGVNCIPHGRIGSWPTGVAAYLAACEHDNEVSPWALKGWAS
jgi:hypothetical protein